VVRAQALNGVSTIGTGSGGERDLTQSPINSSKNDQGYDHTAQSAHGIGL